MQIDRNPIMLEAIEEFKIGNKIKGREIQDVFIDELNKAVANGEDHCPCKNSTCKYHGNCRDCVALHRGHMDHLPVCMHGVVNEQLKCLTALTENSIVNVIRKENEERNARIAAIRKENEAK